MVHALLGGILPRSETYMRTHWDHAKGFCDDEGLAAAAREEESRWLQAQQEAGLEPVAPALVRTEDLLRPLSSHLENVSAGSLTRYFETNTFFRQPEVTGPIAAPADPTAWFQDLPAAQSGDPWILTLPSPWDAAVRSADSHHGDPAASALAYGHALNAVARAAVDAGALRIRFHDPSILYTGTRARGDAAGDTAAFHTALAAAGAGIEAHCVLHLTNGDPYDRPEVLAGNPLRGLSIEDPGRAPPADLVLPAGTELHAAVLVGQESLVEDPSQLRAAAENLAQALEVPLWAITNGWDLDHVPHTIGRKKVAALGAAATATSSAATEMTA